MLRVPSIFTVQLMALALFAASGGSGAAAQEADGGGISLKTTIFEADGIDGAAGADGLARAQAPAREDSFAIGSDGGDVSEAPPGQESTLTGSVAGPSVATPTPPLRRLEDPNGAEPTRAPVDPYAALGISAGAFRLFPEIDLGFGYSDNVFRNDGGPQSGDVSFVARPAFRLESDWVRHSLVVTGKSGHQLYSKSTSEDIHEARIEAAGRVDIRSDTTLDLAAGYRFAQESRGSIDVPGTAAELPDVHTVSASAEGAHRFNRLRVALRGRVEDVTIADVRLTGGGMADNSDRDYAELSGRFQVAYELSPAIQPFAELTLSDRAHDRKVDDNGERRDSTGYVVAAGARIDLSPVTKGEFAAGYLESDYADPALASIGDFFLRGDLTWQPSALTTVRLTAKTGVEETTVAGASGSVERSVEMQLAHAFRENLTATGTASYTHEVFKGITLTEETYVAALALLYRLNREVALKAEYVHVLNEDSVGGGFTDNALFVGLNLRR